MRICLESISKSYRVGGRDLAVLREVDFRVKTGEFVSICGPSGSGKSTLLHIIGLLEKPGSGAYLFDGKPVQEMDDNSRSRLRAEAIGFVFQAFNLVPTLTVLENVMLPFLYNDMDAASAKTRSCHAISRVGLTSRINHRPNMLSGGEMQRVAIARAIATRPRLILADEPTGNLDSATGSRILDIFQALHAEGSTLLLITHDAAVAARASRRVFMEDGILV
ncbi:MAG: macrolide ABC transporter ATP-binding protein [Deltaproteobacteria bacterium]|nr:MAG: macrolide ABC transporter ATP-binding protein [Deltaproteobacteria bacterium]